MNNISASLSRFRVDRKHLLMVLVVVGSLTVMLSRPPFGQNPQYHNFADRRAFFGIPNFLDVASNLAFLIVGIAGITICLRHRLGKMRGAWLVMFAGVTLVSVGSAFYHLHPNSETLVWDRLPMTIGFVGLLVAVLGEYISSRLGVFLLAPALLLGSASVVYWHWSDDLRLYIWVQLISLLIIPVVMVLYRTGYSHQWLLLTALGWYGLAKISEVLDMEIFGLSGGLVSGHTIKHLLSALGCLTIVWMLQKRSLLSSFLMAFPKKTG